MNTSWWLFFAVVSWLSVETYAASSSSANFEGANPNMNTVFLITEADDVELIHPVLITRSYFPVRMPDGILITPPCFIPVQLVAYMSFIPMFISGFLPPVYQLTLEETISLPITLFGIYAIPFLFCYWLSKETIDHSLDVVVPYWRLSATQFLGEMFCTTLCSLVLGIMGGSAAGMEVAILYLAAFGCYLTGIFGTLLAFKACNFRSRT